MKVNNIYEGSTNQPIRACHLIAFHFGMQLQRQISPLAIISSQAASEGGVK
jgi:hypothetical protein